MKANYKFLSFLYDLIDVLYFNRKKHSPRTALLKIIPDESVRVLDVCTGTGSNSLVIAKNKAGAKITALDLSADMLKIADKKFNKANVGNIKTVDADACDTGFVNNSFDIILLSLVLHEIEENLRQAMLNEAKRVLNDNGRIIIIEWEQPKKLFQRMMFSLIKAMEPKGFKEFLYSDLTAYFQSFGLTIADKQSCDYSQVLTLLKNERLGEQI